MEFERVISLSWRKPKIAEYDHYIWYVKVCKRLLTNLVVLLSAGESTTIAAADWAALNTTLFYLHCYTNSQCPLQHVTPTTNCSIFEQSQFQCDTNGHVEYM
jgi:hypothetical protein